MFQWKCRIENAYTASFSMHLCLFTTHSYRRLNANQPMTCVLLSTINIRVGGRWEWQVSVFMDVKEVNSATPKSDQNFLN